VSGQAPTSVPFDDELLVLDERGAVRRHLDHVNSQVLSRLLVVFAIFGAIYGIDLGSRGAALLGAAAAVNLAACLAVRRNLDRPLIRDRIRFVAAVSLLAQYILLLVYCHGSPENAQVWTIVMPFLVMLLRFDAAEVALLLAGLLAITSAPAFVGLLGWARGTRAVGSIWGVLLTQFSVSVVAFALSMGVKRRSSRRFLARWRGEVERHRDRLRMKQELEHAREVQLSMLPREGPGLAWLDTASVSLPATEVGGDYYDYFAIDENRLAVVVGDVAGHGLTSGLVLSGVRAGLNMLETELTTPGEALRHLNRMLVRTNPRGIIVTLLLAVLDRSSPSLLLANAGNPPPLYHRAGSGQARELTSGSLPLGARHEATWSEVVADFGPGDSLLLFTDGLAEIADATGQQYGYARVATAFAAACRQPSAKSVRDELLREAWSFKGTADQVDDVTLVVIRRKED
jgi:hypothetical protein